jgi:hypothetical protein
LFEFLKCLFLVHYCFSCIYFDGQKFQEEEDECRGDEGAVAGLGCCGEKASLSLAVSVPGPELLGPRLF